MAGGGFSAVHEDDEDWLQGYLASTKYGSDAKINSNPVRPKKEEKKEKKFYKLHFVPKSQGNRRSSWTGFGGRERSAHPKPSAVTPRVEALPERVNAIRQTGSGPEPPAAGHFVREHRKSKEHPESLGEGARKAAKVSQRRRTLDYDELDAVKARVMQAASVWEEKQMNADDSEEAEDSTPASHLPASAAIPMQTQTAVDIRMVSPAESGRMWRSKSGRGWLFGRWGSSKAPKAAAARA